LHLAVAVWHLYNGAGWGLIRLRTGPNSC
jgi:hypothetical protein